MIRQKAAWLLTLAGIVVSGLSVSWIKYTISGQVFLQGDVAGGIGTPPETASQVSERAPGEVQEGVGTAIVPDRASRLTGLWVSERSGKPYFVDEANGRITIFEGGPDYNKIQVGSGERAGSKLTIQFHSTLDNVDGVLELELSDDSKTLNGFFRGFDPTEEGRVRLLRSTDN